MGKLEFKYPFSEYPFYILYILIPVLALILMILAYRKKERIMNVMRMHAGIRFKLLRNVLMTLGLGLMVFSLLGPQTFTGFTEVSSKGMDVYVLIDTSKSMLVEDVQPNRISRAKKIIENIIDNLEGDRIGFIPFSQDAYVQMPLTDDYPLARMFLNVIDTEMLAGGGTNIAAALSLANKSFERVSSADRVIVVLSDGEEHDSSSLDIIKKMKDDHLKVFTIGIGSEKGGLIPIYDDKAKERTGFKKDNSGNFVTSRLNPETLIKLADSGNGSYYQSSLSSDDIEAFMKQLSSLKRDTLKTDKIRRFNQLYQYFLGAGVLLFIAACLLPMSQRQAVRSQLASQPERGVSG